MNGKNLYAIVLMPFGSVGSNLLVHLLNTADNVDFVNEPLTAIQTRARTQSAVATDATIEQEQMKWLSNWFSSDGACLDNQDHEINIVHGCKLSVDSLHTSRVVDAFVRFVNANASRISLISMRRRDVTRTAVSLARKEIFAAQTGRWGVDRDAHPLDAVVLDVDHVVELAQKCAKRDADMSKLLELLDSSVPIVDLEYAEWARSEATVRNTAAAIAHRLGATCSFGDDEPLPFRKATPHDLRAAVKNYDAVSCALSDAGFASNRAAANC